MRLRGKTVLVTGAGSGIGKALAIDAAKRGARLVLVGRREDALTGTAKEIGDQARCLTVAADVTQAADRQRVVLTTILLMDLAILSLLLHL